MERASRCDAKHKRKRSLVELRGSSSPEGFLGRQAFCLFSYVVLLFVIVIINIIAGVFSAKIEINHCSIRNIFQNVKLKITQRITLMFKDWPK